MNKQTLLYTIQVCRKQIDLYRKMSFGHYTLSIREEARRNVGFQICGIQDVLTKLESIYQLFFGDKQC